MDLLEYAAAPAALVNADLAHVDALVAHLDGRADLQRRATDRDCMLLRKLQRELRPVFDASAAGAAERLVAHLNALLAEHPVTPQLMVPAGRPAHGRRPEVALTTERQSVADVLTTEALLGLVGVLTRFGTDRLGSCAAVGCAGVFVDTSPTHSRRYCSERCATRAHVAAYRARRRVRP